MNQLKTQTVLGLIKSAPVADKSRKFSTAGVRHSNIRSTGIYTEKTYNGVVVGYWNGHGWREQSAQEQLATFVQFATNKGYKLTQQSKTTYLIELA
jgi:hypothetical protein